MKKGFTLLELLAVVVVLAIIALIVTPVIANTMKTAKKGAFSNSAYGMISSAELYYGKNITVDETPETLITINDFIANESNFNYKGKEIELAHLEINEKGKMKMFMWSDGFCATKEYDDAQITVTQKPKSECNLIGPLAPVLSGLTTADCVANSKTISVTSPVDGVTYYYYLSRSAIQLVGGSWNEMVDNQAIITTEGIHYVYVRGIKDNVTGVMTLPQEICIDNTEYPITINASTGGTLTSNSDAAQIGEEISLTSTPNTGYHLGNIVAINSNNASTNINLGNLKTNMQQGGITINPTWSKTDYALTWDQTTGGIITVRVNNVVATSPASVKMGDIITVITTPTTGYQLDSLMADSTNITSTKTFTMPANAVTITSTWSKIPYTLTWSQSTGGTIAVKVNNVTKSSPTTVVVGDTITVTTSPATNYQLNSLMAGSTDITSTKTLTMPANAITINPTWRIIVITKYRSRTYGTYTCTNKLTNGGFEGGNTGWTIPSYGASARINYPSETRTGSYCVAYDRTGTSGSDAYMGTYQNVTLTSGHKFYGRYYAKTWGSGASLGSTQYNGKIFGTYIGTLTPTWTLKSVYTTGSGAQSQFMLGKLSVSSVTNAYLTFDDCVVFDLTQCFGSGNEPTKDWLDTNFTAGVTTSGTATFSLQKYTDWTNWTTTVCSGSSDVCISQQCLVTSPVGACTAP